MKNQKITLLAALAVPAMFAAQAMAVDTIMTFGYTDLAGRFSGDGAGNGTFTADAVNNAQLASGGDVSRLSSPSGTATFSPGFVSGLDAANFHLDISVFGNDGNIAFGSGAFIITDLDGDTVSGNIDGFWVKGASTGQGSFNTFFNGDLSNVVLSDNGAADGLFNGNSGAFDLNLGFPGVFEGALVQLFLQPGSDFFRSDFRNISTQVSGEIVPAPSAASVAGLMAIAGLRRRRR